MKNAKRILKAIELNSDWTKVDLKKFNDFYLIGLKKSKINKRKDTLDKDCVKKIRFEIAIPSGKKNKYLTINYLTLNFSDLSSSDLELNNISAITKVTNYPSTFFIKAIDMTGESSVVTEGRCSIEVFLNETRIK